MANEMQAMGFESLGEAPARVVKQLEGVSLDKLAAIFKRAEAAGVRAWMLCALCVGVGMARTRRGDRASHALAERWGVSRKTIERLARVYRELIEPRLTNAGDRACFPIGAQAFYLVAVHAADVTNKPALGLLELAEQRKEKNPRYSAARFRVEVLGTERRSPAPKLAKLLRALARVRLADVEAFAACAEPGEWAGVLAAVSGRVEELGTRLGLSDDAPRSAAA